MNENEILKKIDELIIETDNELNICYSTNDLYERYELFYYNVIEYMKNYEKILEVNHFKQTEI